MCKQTLSCGVTLIAVSMYTVRMNAVKITECLDCSNLVHGFLWQNNASPTSVNTTKVQFWLPLASGFSYKKLDKISENVMGQLMAIWKEDFADCFQK